MSKYQILALEGAVRDGNLEAIEEIGKSLKDYQLTDAENSKIWQMVSHKCDDNAPAIIRKLVELGMAGDFRVGAVAEAMRFSPKNVPLLLDLGFDGTLFDRKGKSALHTAVKKHSFRFVILIVDEIKKRGNFPEKDLNDSFVRACRRGELNVVKYLLENTNVDVNCQDSKWKSTPLMFAAQFGRVVVFKYLISKGADPNLKNRCSGRTVKDFISPAYRKCDDDDKIKEIEKEILEIEKAKDRQEKLKKGIVRTLIATDGEEIILKLNESLELTAFFPDAGKTL
jgi:hypothetical protein